MVSNSLKILGEIIDLRIHKFKTGSRVLIGKYLKNGIYLMLMCLIQKEKKLLILKTCFAHS